MQIITGPEGMPQASIDSLRYEQIKSTTGTDPVLAFVRPSSIQPRRPQPVEAITDPIQTRSAGVEVMMGEQEPGEASDPLPAAVGQTQ